MTTTPRFHDEDLHLRLQAFDPEGLSGRRDFLVTVMQVNDPPGPFDLLMPADQDTIPVNQLRFSWQRSVNLDEDPIRYTLYLKRSDGETHLVESIADTTFHFEELPPMLLPDYSYSWWVVASDEIDQTESNQRFSFRTGDAMPLVYELRQNFPNPWRGDTTIEYWIPVESRVRLEVYDVLGRRVQVLMDEPSHEPGIFRRTLRGGSLASGVYFYRLSAQGVNGSRFMKVRQMTLIR